MESLMNGKSTTTVYEKQDATSQRGLGAAGANCSVFSQNNVVHGDVTNVQNNYFEGLGHRPGWNPLRRCAAVDFEILSRNFCGRDQELKLLNSVLKSGEASLRCALYGISGLGKSHLAIKYGKVCYESGKYTHVFWIAVDTETKLLNGLESILVKLDHPPQLESDQKTKVEIVRRWLEDANEDHRWLLVLDNARRETFETLRNNLPNKSPHGHILLTTQFEDIAKEFVNSQPNPLSLLRLRPLAVDDGVRLLIASSQMSAEDLSEQDQEKARRLVQRTGCHPLAITFAAACATTASTLPDLLHQTSTDQLVMITEHENSLVDTDQRVIRRLFDNQVANIQDEPLALDLFRTLSFLDSSSISINMLWRGIQSWQATPSDDEPINETSKKLWYRGVRFVRKRLGHSTVDKRSGETLGQAIASPSPYTRRRSDLQKSIQTLIGQNLIQVASPGVVSMHDLTNHMSLRSMEDAEITSRYQDDAYRLICSAFESIKEPSRQDNWLASDEVIPHLLKLSSDANKIKSGLDKTVYEAAKYTFDRGRYSDSQSLYDRLVIMRKRHLNATHPKTLAAMHDLANVFRFQGHLGEAKDLFQHVLNEKKKQSGASHPSTLTTMHNLACVYKLQGRFQDAEKLHQRVLVGQEKQLGSIHPDTLSTMHDLAAVYKSQGRLSDAEELYQIVLVGQKKQLGPIHPDTLSTMHNLAAVYKSRGRFRDAEELYQLVLNGQKNQLGPSHPGTLSTMHNLACVYKSQGRFKDAEALHQHVLNGQNKQLGPTHPDTLTTMHNLAGAFYSQGRYREAEELFHQVLDVEKKQVLGPTHPLTLTTSHDLARVYGSQGRFREAEELYQHVLDERKKQLGRTHPDTISTMHMLARLYERQARHQEAEELFKYVLYERKRQLGPMHPKTLDTMHHLANVFNSRGLFQKAEELFQHVLEGQKKQLGPMHPESLSTMHHLAVVHRSQSRSREAEDLFQYVLDGRKKVLGPEHPEFLNTVHALALLYESQSHYSKAEKLLQVTLAGREIIFGPHHDWTVSVRQDLEKCIRQKITNLHVDDSNIT